jgi:hypothetical protein
MSSGCTDDSGQTRQEAMKRVVDHSPRFDRDLEFYSLDLQRHRRLTTAMRAENGRGSPLPVARRNSMWNAYQQFCREILRWAMSLNRQEWLILLVAVTIIGFFCMRGYGSRNNY